MENNKVVLSNGDVVMDITDTTAEAADVAAGKVFYNAAGVRSNGTGNYMDKVPSATQYNVAIFDDNGQVVDAGVSMADRATMRGWNDSSGFGSFIEQAQGSSNMQSFGFMNTSDPDILYWETSADGASVYKNIPTKKYVDDSIAKEATETTAGTIKLNPSQSITLNAQGQLEVGGRLGQFPNGGVFYPTTIEPSNVGGSSFLMTDGAKGLFLGSRQFAIMAGANLTCKSASAGSTQYRLSNTQTNRFACFAGKNGRLAIDQNDAVTNGTALITDISFSNGNPISSYFGPTESDNDIIITVDRTVNPSGATTKLRIYGTSTSNDVIAVGQGVGGTHGKAIVLGQSCFGGGNQIIALGNSVHVIANNSSGFGHTILVNKQYCLAAGQGHDFTNASNGASALGICSDLKSDTLFAVGNGVFASSGEITRSNAFEVKNDGGIVVPSSTVIDGVKSTKKFKITVDDTGTLTATEVQ